MAPARGRRALSERTWGVVGAGAVAAAGAVLLACWSAPPLSSDLAAPAERIELEAERAGAAQFWPERYAAYRDRLVEARAVLRQEAARWCLLRDRSRVAQAFAELERDGEALLAAARQRSAELQREAAGRLVVAERRLGELRALVNDLGMDLPPAPLSAAELALREARQYADAGAYERTRDLVERAWGAFGRAERHAQSQIARYLGGSALARWQRWIRETVALSHAGPAVVIAKAERRLVVYRSGRVVADYPVELGYNALADKLYEGDGATPEGRFRIVAKKSGAETRYYLALLLDYPTPADRRRHRLAVRRGLIPPRAYIGGLIEIHGQVPGPTERTSGCVGLEHRALARVFDLVEVGTPVTIVGAASRENPVAQRGRARRQVRLASL